MKEKHIMKENCKII